MSQLSVKNISKEYPTRAEPLVVLRDVSFDMSAGDNLAILGPSGSGKSTLLHVIGALDRPTAGTVSLNEQDPYTLGESELALFRNQRIGFIFQDHHLLPQLSVLENVLIPAMAQGKVDAESLARAHELLERVGLKDRISHRPSELSGGEKERTAVARALIRRPLVLLADEPTGNLDRFNAQRIATLLLELQASESAMLIVVTHSRELAAMMQRRLELNNGSLVEVA